MDYRPPPFRVNVIGPSEGGKTSSLRYLLDRKRGPLGTQLSTIIGFGEDSPDYDFCDKVLPPDAEVVRKVIKEQMGKPKDRQKSLCLVFDDLTGNGWEPNGQHRELFKWISVQSRHYNISFILVCQYLKVLSPLQRENATLVIITAAGCSQNQLNCLAENIPVDRSTFLRLMKGVRVGVILEIPVSGSRAPRLVRVPKCFATKSSF